MALTTRDAAGSCHLDPPGDKPTTAVARAAVLAALLCLGCASDPAAALELAPIGRHDVAIGQAWIWPLQLRGAELPTTVEVVQGPAAMLVMNPASAPTLAWQPTVFDLAATPPGSDRAAGSERAVHVRVRDAAGRAAEAHGVVRAVPAEVP